MLMDFIPLLGASTYYERIMEWRGGRLIPLERILKENRFSEYIEAGRISKFEELVRTLKKNHLSVGLMANK